MWNRLVAIGWTLLAAWLCAAGAARAEPVAARANYVASLAGINIATGQATLTDDGVSYRVDLFGEISGLATVLAQGTMGAHSEGQIGRAGLLPSRFHLFSQTPTDGFTANVGFAGGAAVSFVTEPPLPIAYDRVPIERAQLAGVLDPIAAFLLRGGSLDPSLCQKRLGVFTGLERFDIAMRFVAAQTATSLRTGYQGPVVLCAIDYAPISGHYMSSEITAYLAGSERILVWYAPLGATGYFLPYRVLIGTTLGDLSVVLTGVSGTYSRP